MIKKIFQNDDNNNDIIILKDGNNYVVIAIALLAILGFVFLITSKMWLPDDRDFMTTINNEYVFENSVVEIKKDKYEVDYSENIAQVFFTKNILQSIDDKEIKYKVYNENDEELPYELINSNLNEESLGSTVFIQNQILQFGVVKNFYYVRIEIVQETFKYNIILDYRSFKEATIIERDEKYLITLGEEEKILHDLKEETKKIEEEKQNLLNQLGDYNIQSEEYKNINSQFKIDLDNRIIVIDKILEENPHKIKVSTEKIKQLKSGTYVYKEKEEK